MILNGYEEIKLEYSYFGLKMQQNRYAPIYIDRMLEIVKPNLIIEFGTRTGGLAVLLGLWASANNSKVITYDLEAESLLYRKLLKILDVEIVNSDIYSLSTIQSLKELIHSSNRTIILCDAGKIKEFNIYSDFIKSGDVIMAHDYAIDDKDFKLLRSSKIWHCNEIMQKDIEEACIKNNLSRVNSEAARATGWGIFIKK